MTVRGTAGVISATHDLAREHRLLHSHRDLDEFESHLSLQVVSCGV